MAEVVAEVAAAFVENLGHVHVRTCGKYLYSYICISIGNMQNKAQDRDFSEVDMYVHH